MADPMYHAQPSFHVKPTLGSAGHEVSSTNNGEAVGVTSYGYNLQEYSIVERHHDAFYPVLNHQISSYYTFHPMRIVQYELVPNSQVPMEPPHVQMYPTQMQRDRRPPQGSGRYKQTFDASKQRRFQANPVPDVIVGEPQRAGLSLSQSKKTALAAFSVGPKVKLSSEIKAECSGNPKRASTEAETVTSPNTNQVKILQRDPHQKSNNLGAKGVSEFLNIEESHSNDNSEIKKDAGKQLEVGDVKIASGVISSSGSAQLSDQIKSAKTNRMISSSNGLTADQTSSTKKIENIGSVSAKANQGKITESPKTRMPTKTPNPLDDGKSLKNKGKVLASTKKSDSTARENDKAISYTSFTDSRENKRLTTNPDALDNRKSLIKKEEDLESKNNYSLRRKNNDTTNHAPENKIPEFPALTLLQNDKKSEASSESLGSNLVALEAVDQQIDITEVKPPPEEKLKPSEKMNQESRNNTSKFSQKRKKKVNKSASSKLSNKERQIGTGASNAKNELSNPEDAQGIDNQLATDSSKGEINNLISDLRKPTDIETEKKISDHQGILKSTPRNSKTVRHNEKTTKLDMPHRSTRISTNELAWELLGWAFDPRAANLHDDEVFPRIKKPSDDDLNAHETYRFLNSKKFSAISRTSWTKEWKNLDSNLMKTLAYHLKISETEDHLPLEDMSVEIYRFLKWKWNNTNTNFKEGRVWLQKVLKNVEFRRRELIMIKQIIEHTTIENWKWIKPRLTATYKLQKRVALRLENHYKLSTYFPNPLEYEPSQPFGIFSVSEKKQETEVKIIKDIGEILTGLDHKRHMGIQIQIDSPAQKKDLLSKLYDGSRYNGLDIWRVETLINVLNSFSAGKLETSQEMNESARQLLEMMNAKDRLVVWSESPERHWVIQNFPVQYKSFLEEIPKYLVKQPDDLISEKAYLDEQPIKGISQKFYNVGYVLQFLDLGVSIKTALQIEKLIDTYKKVHKEVNWAHIFCESNVNDDGVREFLKNWFDDQKLVT